MALTRLFRDFFESERAGGIVLIFCTIVSLLLANLVPVYTELWQIHVAGHALSHWINDGLMAIFFLLIGLELEREIYIGKLSNLKTALLPVVAAIGGMIVPAAIYYGVNVGEGSTEGVGIPMATDIAFALGALSLAGKRVPLSLKIFLTALAVIDDLGAILVIAVFYTQSINWVDLGIASGIFVLLIFLNRLSVFSLWPYLLAGAVMWYFMLHSGVHATITGVLVAFAIPFRKGDQTSGSYRLQHFLHKPVAFIILPVFALANTSIILQSDFYTGLGSLVSVGIMSGLFIGKPTGIVLFSFAAVKMKICKLPDDLSWMHIVGAGLLGGIGFTMSIFVTLLAFSDPVVIDQSKISVMAVSLLAGFAGFFWLKMLLRKTAA